MQELSAKPKTKIASDWLPAQASELGFDLCGVLSASDLLPPEHLAEWLDHGFAGEMRYLHDPRRTDPAAVLPEARSAIVCAVNYNPPAPYSTEAAARAALDAWSPRDPAAAGSAKGPKGWISRYAWGDDYHLVVGERLDRLVDALREQFGPDFAARAYVDTGPIAERMAAKLAGLGWLGKNTCLINRELGSWLFLGVILTSLEPEALAAAPPSPAPDLCGHCSLCIDACPTGALVEPYLLDARRCISYLTIELRGPIPEEFRAPMGWQVFGCDICQDVCPWNRAAPAASLPGFASNAQTKSRLEAPELLWLLSLSEEEFRKAFRQSAVRRAKWRGLIRNACVAAGNALRQSSAHREGLGPRRDSPSDSLHSQLRAELRAKLAEWAASDDVGIAEHARWALAQERSSVPEPHGSAGDESSRPFRPGA